MKTSPSALGEVKLVQLETFRDHRGEFVQTFHRRQLESLGVAGEFVQDDISISHRNVLRGIHVDSRTHKLISCLVGQVFAVVACCQEKSPCFGQWHAWTLSEETRLLLSIPPGYGLAYLATTDTAIVSYKQSTYYDPSAQRTFRFDDPRFGITWPISDPILSERDRLGT
jgi:dTDP-4-dehydrorhamnose 3,5-epimerase